MDIRTLPAQSARLKGAAYGLAAASIWAGWSAATRLAVTTGLDAWDIPVLRFGIASVVMAPVVARRGLVLDRLGWGGLATIVIGGGAPYALIGVAGLRFAPAAELSSFNPGLVPLFVGLISAALGERISAAQRSGLALIVAGALAIAVWHGEGWDPRRGTGEALALSAALLWAGFTVAMRRARLDPLHAAALVATGSAALYLPGYLVLRGGHLAGLPFGEVAVQATYQGIAVTIVSLVLYGRAVALLGAPAGAAFGALVPALTALLAIPLLGEWPGAAVWLSIAFVSAGVYLASGGKGLVSAPAQRG